MRRFQGAVTVLILCLLFFIVASCQTATSPKQDQVMLSVAPSARPPANSSYLSLEIPSGDAGAGEMYTFTAVPHNIPELSFYSWWIDGNLIAEQKVDGMQLETPPGYFLANTSHKIRVRAEWVDLETGDLRSKDASAIFTVASPQSGSVVIIIPSGEGKGANVEYVFKAVPQNVPVNAEYSWWINDTLLKADDPFDDGDRINMQYGRPYKVLGSYVSVNELELRTCREFFETDHRYKIGFVAKWLDDAHQQHSASGAGIFTVTEPDRKLPPYTGEPPVGTNPGYYE